MAAPTILVTGATGFVGGAALAALARTHPDARLLALVRAPSELDAAERVRRSLVRFAEPHLPAPNDRPVEAIVADLTRPQSLADPRLNSVTHVLHAAANTSFRSVRGVRRANILGTMALAHRLRRSGRVERFLFVSTAFCCGEAPPGAIITEDAYPSDDARHLVEYTSSKAETERLLEATAPELPLVIARPSVVVGHSRLGCGPSASLFWVYRAIDLLRRKTEPLTSPEDVVPVDYVAEALIFLLLKQYLRYTRYHVSAGAAGSCTWRELGPAFDRHHGARADDPFKVTTLADILGDRARLAPRFGPGDAERLFMALGLYFRFPSLVFDNRRLIAEGAPPPPRFVDYLDACMTSPGGRSVYDQMSDDD